MNYLSEAIEGYFPSEPDERDFTLETLGLKSDASLLGTDVHIELELPPFVYDQGKSGRCAAYSLAMLMSIINKTEDGYYPQFFKSDLYAKKPTPREGESLRNMLKTAYHKGVAPATAYPDVNIDDNLLTLEQCQEHYHKNKATADFQGELGRISHYYKVETKEDIIDTLEMGFPIYAGIMIYENFIPDANYKIPEPSGRKLYGHAILIVGYREKDDHVKILNSWSKRWGKNGTAWIPRSMLIDMYGVVDNDTKVQAVWFKVGLDYYSKNGERVYMRGIDAQGNEVKVFPFIQDGRTYVPLRYAAEALGGQVEWFPNGQVISIKK